jgi:hypothetical protein
MTPGVWLSLACADLTNTRRLWDAVRAHAPPAWGLKPGDPALCAAIGIAPEDIDGTGVLEALTRTRPARSPPGSSSARSP